MKTLFSTAAIAAALFAGTVQANCIPDSLYESVQIRDVETMLMVATLRCRLVGVDFTESYNQFVRDKRPILNAASTDMRSLFIKNYGAAKAEGAYDDFMTKVANGFGGGTDGLKCQDYASIAQAAQAAPSTREGVILLANNVGSLPKMPWARCGSAVASKSP
jgi:hypothetical protein